MPFIRNLSLLLATVLMVSCSTDGVLENEHEVNNQTPMVFGTSFSSTETVVTRAAVSLDNDFKVGTWKHFGDAREQLVMNGYKVAYTATATPYRWDYVGVNEQVQRYWDLGAFPYEFRAVSPYFEGADIMTTGIRLDLSDRPFRAQTYKNEVYNCVGSESESCVVSHVSRLKNGSDYEDLDQIKRAEINADAKANAVREVHMPFHHLISKVGFRIFIDDVC